MDAEAIKAIGSLSGPALLVAGLAIFAFLAWKFNLLRPTSSKTADKVIEANTEMVEQLRASYERHFAGLMARIQAMDTKLLANSDELHRHAVLRTRMMVVLVHVKGLIDTDAITVSEYINAEITEILRSA